MKYDWREAGEEWSQPWGNSAAQWSGTIFPRIREFLPTDTILEIAPGFGRWTHYLKDYCDELWAVDKSSECIGACRDRFAGEAHVHCCLNDGRNTQAAFNEDLHDEDADIRIEKPHHSNIVSRSWWDGCDRSSM